MNDLTELIKFSNFESYVDDTWIKRYKPASKNLHFPKLALKGSYNNGNL